MSNKRYICIHGHFYQPPRENPWLEVIETQDSAAPFHNWNERITAECYSPNSAARIQDNQGHILGIINNYEKMSFNFGPTLLSWMEAYEPEVYKEIIEADKKSLKQFNGHGSAIAQVYNHIIMPLANPQDKETQILWGISDFETRFGRKPEGMWLAETAVDTATLCLLARNGIKFTVLSPYQAKQIRKISADHNEESGDVEIWKNVEGKSYNLNTPYLCNLPDGGKINLFFYNGEISQAVAFDGILSSGEEFAARLMTGFDSTNDENQLLHIATDGETFGHHHKFGDMALAYAFYHIEKNDLATLTNYSEYLSKFPPQWEVKIKENSSWSCSHGVERWRSNCGCNTGGEAGWTQEWRGPLRESLDWLRDSANKLYDPLSSQIFKNPRDARNEYVSVILNRSNNNINDFISKHAQFEPVDETQRVQALKLMELQRQLMLMYTSCGWFFTEVSGVETVQVLNYAGRALQLIQELFSVSLESEFLEKLSHARSNIPEMKTAAEIYRRFVKPETIDLIDYGSHYAISSLFKSPPRQNTQNAFSSENEQIEVHKSGNARIALGTSTIKSNIVKEKSQVTFCTVHLIDAHLVAGVRGKVSHESYETFKKEILDSFHQANFSKTLKILDQFFYNETFSLEKLFKDERQHIVNQILKTNLAQAFASFKLIYELNANLLRYLTSLNTPKPEILNSVGTFVLTNELIQLLKKESVDIDQVRDLLSEANHAKLSLDSHRLRTTLNSVAQIQIKKLEAGTDVSPLNTLLLLTDLNNQLNLNVDLWKVQNSIFNLSQTTYKDLTLRAETGNEEAVEWLELFNNLSNALKVKIEA